MLRTRSILLCILAACACSGHAAAEDSAWEPAATTGGVPYQSMDELRSFYKLSTGAQPSRKGAYTLALGDVRLEFGPGKREMSIGGIRLALSYPLHRDTAGNLLIAREDWVHWVDPILRPTYIAGRAPVRTVVIDAGHGGHDVGLSSPAVREAEATLQIAAKLRAALEKLGLQVILTRTGDYFLSDQQRVDLANQAQNAVFVSLHLNSGRSDFRGARVYTLAPGKPGSHPRPGNGLDSQHAALAYALQSALVRQAGAADGGCHCAHFSLLSSITCPAVWVELGYATHEQEGPALASAAYQDTLAHALASGIATYAHVADPATTIPVQAPPPKVVVKNPPPTPKKTTTQETTKRQTPPANRRSSADSFRQRARNSRTRSR